MNGFVQTLGPETSICARKLLLMIYKILKELCNQVADFPSCNSRNTVQSNNQLEGRNGLSHKSFASHFVM